VARAKRTARAEARRRHRAEQGLPTTESFDDVESEPAVGTDARVPSARIGIFSAFRLAFRPLDIRGDLRALPSIALHSKALWVPILITVGSTIAFAVTNGADLVTRFLFAYFIQTPAIGGVFLAGFLAPRASWLLGIIVGAVASACYAALIFTVFSAVLAASPTPGQTEQTILYAIGFSPLLGAFFAAAAAWYRRFLQLSNPNRGRQPAAARRGPDGKSRAGAQKAGARR
jgi:hypothetical protein